MKNFENNLSYNCEFEFEGDKLILSTVGFYNYLNKNADVSRKITRMDAGMTREEKSEIVLNLERIERVYESVFKMKVIFQKEKKWLKTNEAGFEYLDVFAELELVNVWVRVIDREDEANLYIKFYKK